MSTSTNPLSSPLPWDLVAEGYSEEREAIMEPMALEALRRMSTLSPRAVGAGGRIVDVACGPGTLAIPAAERGVEVDALDFSPQMLQELREKSGQLSLRNLRVTEGDGQQLPYEDESFDAAFSLFGLMFFPDRPRAFAELLRVLRPGAYALVTSWAPLDEAPLMDLLFGALRAADPGLPAPQKNMLSLENDELFQREFEAAGFTDVRIERVGHTLAVGGAEELWEKMTRSAAPLVLLRHRLGEEEWARRAEISLAWLRRQLAEGLSEARTVALFGVGRKPA